MKYLLAVVSALVCVGFASAAHHIPAKTCYSCMKSSLSECGMDVFNCSNSSFPNVGKNGGDCYTFVGWYWSNGMWNSGAVRGCADCSNMDGTKESIKNMSLSSMRMWDFNLMFADIKCCESTNCNNETLALPPHPSSTVTHSASSTVAVEENSGTSPTEPESGAYSNFLSSFAFVMTAIVLLFK